MYVLTGTGAFYISRGVDHDVGRKADCAITLIADAKHAISRKHGILSCRNNGELCYTDQSTFGTLINGKKIVKETLPIKAGDILKFGVHPTEWVLAPVQVVPSSLPSAVRSNLINICKVLDVSYSPKWTENSTTLVMANIAVTMKVLNAVAERRSIVTPEFLNACLTAQKESKPPPVVSSYTPPISEKSLAKVNFQSHEKRKTLFNPLVFVFLSQIEKTLLESVVKNLGGSSILLDPLQSDRRDIILSELSVVVDTENVAMSSMAKKLLKERNLVPVKQADITLAVLHMDKHKLFKKVEDSSTNYSHLMVESQACTQAFASQVILNTDDVHSDLAKTKDISFLEPSHVPPKLDKSSKSFLQSPVSVRPKETSFLEPSNIPPRLDKTCKDLLVSPANTSKSFLEPSNVPIRLDKTNTFQTPNSKHSSKTPSTPKDTWFLEPSHIPPRLDKTIKSSPADTCYLRPSHILSKVESPNTIKSFPINPSYIDPSNIPARLDNTNISTGISPGPTLKQSLSESSTNTSRLFVEPIVKTSNSVIESPNISRSLIKTPNTSRFDLPDLNTSDASLFSRGNTPAATRTPSRDTTKTYIATPKRNFTMDSDSDEDSNPFQRASSSKRSKLLAPNVSQVSVRSEVITKDEILADSPHNVAPDHSEVPPTKENSEISSSLAPITRTSSSMTISEDDRQLIAGPSDSIQTIKRELTEKVSSIPKRFKSEDITMDVKPLVVVKIAKVGQESFGWISHNSSAVAEHAFSNLTVTDFSVTIVSRDSAVNYNKSTYPQTMGTNFKRFRRKDSVVRSLAVTISVAVEEEEVSGWFSSQAQASQAVFAEQDERARQLTLLDINDDNPFSRNKPSTKCRWNRKRS